MFTNLLQQLLGAYSSDVLVFVTAVLVGITAFYAIQTKRTVEVLRKTADMEFLPRIKGHVHMIGPVNLNLRISNVGKGSASDVSVNFIVKGQKTLERTWIQPLLLPNQFQDFFIPISENEEKSDIPYFENNYTIIELSAAYKDILGNKHSNKEKLDISEFVRQFKTTKSVYHEGTDEKITRNIEKISDNLNAISRELKEIGSIISDRNHHDLIEFKFRNIYHKLNNLEAKLASNTEIEILLHALETELLTYKRNDLLTAILTRMREINAEVHSLIMTDLKDILE